MPSRIGYYVTIVGALNWGLVGIGDFAGTNLNVLSLLLGSWSSVLSVAYIVVGVAGVMTLIGCSCATCKALRCCGDASTPAA
jgi:uncharacterized membrane protein YuzA (DUF378 family)